MEQDQMSGPAPQKRFSLWLIATIVLAVFLIAGGVVFAWQKSTNDKAKDNLQGQINTLQNQIQQLPNTNTGTNINNTDAGQTTPTTLIGIATQLLENYLKSDLSASDPGQKLLDYKINKIEIIKDEDTCFRFDATFSVKPASSTGWMAAGNINSSGWIENAGLGFDATKQANGTYILGQGFTGAGSASCKDGADVTADWKTYTNAKYGFTIKYSPTMSPIAPQSDATGYFIQFSGNAISARISILTAKKYTSLGKFLEETDKIQDTAYEGTPSVQVNKQNNVTVAGFQAIQREQFLIAAAMHDVSTYFLKDGMIFWISTQGTPPPGGVGSTSDSNLLDMNNQMLSTFNFTK